MLHYTRDGEIENGQQVRGCEAKVYIHNSSCALVAGTRKARQDKTEQIDVYLLAQALEKRYL